MATHIDPMTLLIQDLEKANDSKYDSKDQSMYYLIATLIMKIEGIGNQVSGMANESTAFSTVLSDTQKVDDDVTRIQQYAADHPNESASDALMDPAYQADVAAFKKDVMQMNKDAKNYNFNPKYRGDGMDESNDCVNMILNTTIDWRPDGNNQSIVSMIDNNQDGSLGAALFYAAKQPTDSGTFHSWTDGSGAAGAVSLSIVESDYGNFTSNLNQQLNVAGANLQQDNQVGQNFITSMNSMINLIVQHLAPGG